MRLASYEDVVKRLKGEAPALAQSEVEDLLDEASAAIRSYLRCGDRYQDEDDVPDAVRVVVSRMVARRLVTDADSDETIMDGVSQLGAMDYQASFAEPFSSVGVWLTRQDRMMLGPYRCTATAVTMMSDRY